MSFLTYYFSTATCWHTSFFSPNWSLQTSPQSLPDIRLSDASKGKYKALETDIGLKRNICIILWQYLSGPSQDRQAFNVVLVSFCPQRTTCLANSAPALGGIFICPERYCYFQTSGKYNITSTMLHIPKCLLPTLLSCLFIWITRIIKFHSQTRHF